MAHTDTDIDGGQRVVTASRVVNAPAARIFQLIADPGQQPRWDGNDNLAEAPQARRVTAVGDVFVMRITKGSLRDNHVVEFDEGRRIAWRPAEPGSPPPGHLWRWELEPVDEQVTVVRHTYDWSALTDEQRIPRALATGEAQLLASIERLAALAEAAG